MLRELRAEDGELSPGSTAAPRGCFRLIARVSVTDPETARAGRTARAAASETGS
jgi:hypothetical protein